MQRAILSLMVVVVAAGSLPASPSGQAASQKPLGSTEAVLAAHRAVDEGYKRALMSPFTAVAVRYFTPGETVRLGVNSSSAEFAPRGAVRDGIDITLTEGAFWFTPLAGSAVPAVLEKTAEGDAAPAPATPMTSRTRITDTQVVRLDRYLAESFARPDSGNVRVFDPDSAARGTFSGLKWYPPNLALQVKAVFTPIPSPDKIIIPTSRGLKKEYYRVGTLAFAVDGTTLQLTALAASPGPKPGDEIFVPFRDETTGTETYDVGRYLTFPFASGREYVLDFNAATNPLCNYSPHYNCPIPPRENVLPVAIRAGEMKYPKPY